MPLLALAPVLIQLIPVVTTGVEQLIKFIDSIRTSAQQNAEWTPELEDAYRVALLKTRTAPEWQPDPK